KKNIEKEIEKEKLSFEKEKKKTIKAVVANTYEEAMTNYENKNYINKMLFSMTYNKTKILKQEKQISHLIKEGRKHFDRKNEYKKEVSRLRDFEEKYLNLRKDFNKRIENRLEINEKEKLKLNYELKKIKLENEYLKEENLELKEKAKFAIEFLEKAKKYLGSKFESFKNDLFSKPSYNNTQNTKRRKI
ncbi:TPA: hypothetical protein ACRQUY_004898, partial [Escherichia coli]